jgi:hypothetical protein
MRVESVQINARCLQEEVDRFLPIAIYNLLEGCSPSKLASRVNVNAGSLQKGPEDIKALVAILNRELQDVLPDLHVKGIFAYLNSIDVEPLLLDQKAHYIIVFGIDRNKKGGIVAFVARVYIYAAL